MNLLEALIALLILALTAVGSLDAFGASARAGARAREWSRLVAVASSEMDLAAQNLPPVPGSPGDPDLRRSIQRRPWRDDLVEITVTVAMPSGSSFTLRRIVREPSSGPGA